jgi:hypothetical protein
MEVAEVPLAFLLFIQIAQSDIQTNRLVALIGAVEPARFNLDTGVEIDRPFDNVTFSIGLRLGGTFHGSRLNPLLISIPGVEIFAWLTFQQARLAHAAQPRLGQVADHLPALAIAGYTFVGGPFIGWVEQNLHFITEPGEAFPRQLVSLGILLREPAFGIDPVENVISDIKGKVEALAVVFDVGVKGKVVRVGGGRELRNPSLHAEELCGVVPLPFFDETIEFRRLTWEGVE